MKQLKAILMLFVGLIWAVVSWVISLPIIVFTLPIKWYNNALYGEPKKELQIQDLGDKIIIKLPNGEKIVAKKVVEKNGENTN